MNKAIGAFVCLAALSLNVNAQTLKARGVVIAEHTATLSSELTTSVKSLPFELGQGFKKGQLLAKLNCDIFDAQAAKIVAEKNAAKIKLDNVTKLSQLKSVGKLEVALADAEVKKIDAELRIAQINTRRCLIKAPFDGRVAKLHIKNHEVVEQQQAVIDIVGLHPLHVDVIVPAGWAKWLRQDHTVAIQIDETGEEVSGTISHIGPNIDHTSQTLRIQAKIPSTSNTLLPGMSATVSFNPVSTNS